MGRRFERVEILDPRLDPPVRPRRGRRRARRRASRRRRAPRQVSGCSVRIRSSSPDSPPDDGELAAREPRRRARGRRSASPRRCQIRRRIGCRVPRRPPLRHLASPRARTSSTRTSQSALGTRAARAQLHHATLADALAGRRAPVKAASSTNGRLAGHREHLRGRGALAGEDPPAAPGGRARAG